MIWVTEPRGPRQVHSLGPSFSQSSALGQIMRDKFRDSSI